MIVDRRFSGYIHGFQLWVNLPAANKFDAPHFQNASPSALPIAELPGGATVRVMHGALGELCSPTECETVEWQYLDFEVPGSLAICHEPPPQMTTRMAYVYRGAVELGGTLVKEGTLALLQGDGELAAKAEAVGCGFLFIAGRPIGEPIVSHGPFVMASREQIRQCFSDYQQGMLATKKMTQVQYK